MVFHPSHRPLEIAHAIPTVPQPRRRRSSLTNKQNKGTLLSSYGRGHFYWALTFRVEKCCASPGEGVDSCRQRSQIGNPGSRLEKLSNRHKGIGDEPLLLLPKVSGRLLGPQSPVGAEGLSSICTGFAIASALQNLRNDRDEKKTARRPLSGHESS